MSESLPSFTDIQNQIKINLGDTGNLIKPLKDGETLVKDSNGNETLKKSTVKKINNPNYSLDSKVDLSKLDETTINEMAKTIFTVVQKQNSAVTAAQSTSEGTLNAISGLKANGEKNVAGAFEITQTTSSGGSSSSQRRR